MSRAIGLYLCLTKSNWSSKWTRKGSHCHVRINQIRFSKKNVNTLFSIFFRILYQLMSNQYVTEDIKKRMKYAGQLTKVLGGHCKKYSCPALDGY